MTIDKIKELYHAEPFYPFDLHLADGRSIRVAHREFLASAPSGRTVVVFQPDDRMNIVDLLLVTDVEVHVNGRKGKAGK
jgi:hypothetical protein